MDADLEVIQAVLGGEIDRYAELVNRYQLGAWRLAYSFVGNFEDAKEISQNGFVKAYRNLAHFRGGSRFSTWLYRIVVNECKDFFRSRSRQPGLVPLPEEPEGEDPVIFEVADRAGTPADAAEQAETAKRLTEAIRSLPERQRTAFVLCHVQGMTLAETAQVMGCRLGTVKAHVSRACENLREALEPYLKTEVVR